MANLEKYSHKDAAAWQSTHDRFHKLIRDYLIPYYHTQPQHTGVVLQKLNTDPEGKNFNRLWHMTPSQVVDELFESDAVKTLVLSQMAIPRGVALDYSGGGIEVLKMIAGDEKPELARGGSHSIAQVLQRAYVHSGGQIRAVHHVEKILIEDGRAVGVRLRDGANGKLGWRWCPIAIPTQPSWTWSARTSCRAPSSSGSKTFRSMSCLFSGACGIESAGSLRDA